VIGLAPTEPTTLTLDIVKLIASLLLQMKAVNQSINQCLFAYCVVVAAEIKDKKWMQYKSTSWNLFEVML